MKKEPSDIAHTVNDASVMRVVETVDGQEVDITPTPVPEPAVKADKKKEGGKAHADQA